jgi:hypothetical protein
MWRRRPLWKGMEPTMRVGVRLMGVSMAIFFWSLATLGYVVGPVALVWGWVRWVRHPKLWKVTSVFSLFGFLLATASALLAISSVAYARVHYFPYYDPLLMRILRLGALLSMAGFAFAIGGVWRKNVLRWFAVASAVGTIAFWVLAAEAE